MYDSSEGKFNIIDEFAKDHTYSEVESITPEESNGDQKPLRISSRSINCPQLPKAIISSRFRIVPLESKYERGRWNCFDYYDKSTSKIAEEKVSEVALLYQTSKHCQLAHSLNRTCSEQQGTAHAIRSSLDFESSESDLENNDVFARFNANAAFADATRVILFFMGTNGFLQGLLPNSPPASERR
ncbi:hypothetical protein RB195_024405 [Necator americanus]|uniref:Uncharacterized protein n=1 Tax=Necator americanus TaxID=51031 RepID=A0ABR1EN57_NECAM